MVFGVGAFTQSVLHILKKSGAEVYSYLIREQGHYGPGLEGETYSAKQFPNPCRLVQEKEIDFIIPMSIDWMTADWTEELMDLDTHILSPKGTAMRLEHDRDFAGQLCRNFGIPFPASFLARNRLEAEDILQRFPSAYVIKNPLCSPTSPIHTIVCETVEDTRSWLKKINYEEGVFLQEFMGRREAGHIAFVSGGEIYSLITNQEYKWSFDGNQGIIAGAPLGGIVEKDPEDKYQLAKQLLHPLLPWFREVQFNGPVQVTAIRTKDKWSVLEYNVRLGITCAPIILQMLENPLDVLWNVVRNRKLEISFVENRNFGCSLTLAGYGYPYSQVKGPQFPVRLLDKPDCDFWWNEVVADKNGDIYCDGQRIADLVAIESTLQEAITKVYENIRKINCLGSYYRTDIGNSLWPPGSD